MIDDSPYDLAYLPSARSERSELPRAAPIEANPCVHEHHLHKENSNGNYNEVNPQMTNKPKL